MKLIIREYLSMLREREELDAIIPDLLSQLSLNVFSLPQRGTAQNGVDVAAEGHLGEYEGVFLLSIKSGDLGRTDWDVGPQALRPSLNDILDVYIPNRLSVERQAKHIYICLCFGGNIREEVRERVESFCNSHTTEHISFLQWNGDKLADLVMQSFLSESLITSSAKSLLRKSIAMLEVPETSYKYFSLFIGELENDSSRNSPAKIICKINLALWIMFAWGREENLLEAVYLSAELALLHSWELLREKVSSDPQAVTMFFQTQDIYSKICETFLKNNVLDYTEVKYGLSFASKPDNSIDVNLKLFDILGRLCVFGLWFVALKDLLSEDKDFVKVCNKDIGEITDKVVALINNNPALLSPIKDDNAIEIAMTCMLLAQRMDDLKSFNDYLSALTDSVVFALKSNCQYPCILTDYSELIHHLNMEEEAYKEKVTAGSILYPMIALFATFSKDRELYTQIKNVKDNLLPNCNFQLYYLDDAAESQFYTNNNVSGVILSGIQMPDDMDEFRNQIMQECISCNSFNNLSAIKKRLWPIVLVGCRHYRLPVPMNFFYDGTEPDEEFVEEESTATSETK